jgi:hypothetical protein
MIAVACPSNLPISYTLCGIEQGVSPALASLATSRQNPTLVPTLKTHPISQKSDAHNCIDQSDESDEWDDLRPLHLATGFANSIDLPSLVPDCLSTASAISVGNVIPHGFAIRLRC